VRGAGAESCNQILALVEDGQVDLVISDMAPNMNGNKAVDQPRSMYLVELAVEMATQVLDPGGDFVAKVFQDDGYDALLKDLRSKFTKVYTRKSSASRPRSRECM